MFVLNFVLQTAHEEVVQILENIPEITWKAKFYDQINNRTHLNSIYKTKSTINDVINLKKEFQKYISINSKKAPDYWDWIAMNPQCSDYVPDLGQCQYGDAQVSVMNTFSDFRCFQGKDPNRVEYSPQYMLNCYQNEQDSCQTGGLSDWVWRYLKDKGTVPSSCISYQSGLTGKSGKCSVTCDDGSPLPELVQTEELIDICTPSDGDDEEAIKEALINGPISTTIWVYEDLQYYESGVYQHVYGKDIGYSACEIVGYGEENGVKFWKVKNIWGRQWGENGYFKILRGSSQYGGECEIEMFCCQAVV
ncbi:Cathepsin_B [Hexamita inflata]|uniref:Cathepsin B n=1 Tax=Hexamita inflata TaxID=28002 RepID=A0AA86TLL3_9EUKA|nr:Cathepsin B [Hexamita inflata]